MPHTPLLPTGVGRYIVSPVAALRTVHGKLAVRTAPLLLLLSLLAACSGDEFSDERTAAPGPLPTVAFTLSDTGSTLLSVDTGSAPGATRGVPVGSVSDMRDFRADAYLHRAGQAEVFFQRERQYEQSSEGVFRCDNAYLWPHEAGDAMDFVALAPWEVAEGLTISQQGDFTYTVPPDAKDQRDLLFATAEGVECPSAGSGGVAMREPVPLNFRHLLTQVRFVFGARVADYYRGLTVHSVRVESVAATGTWSAAAEKWTNLGPQTNSFQITASDQIDGPGNGVRPHVGWEMDMWKKDYTMFLLPQTLPPGARVAVDMSYKPSSAADASVRERETYYICLDGKQLLPGHTVTVEVNSNYTSDCRVVDLDGNGVELLPLPAKGQSTTFNVLQNVGGGSLNIQVAPECAAYATLSTDLHSEHSTGPISLGGSFTVHTTDNTSPSDRFIRLLITPGHADGQYSDHLVVLKQRGAAGYGTFTDLPEHEDTMQPWGFNWPVPLNVVAHYDGLFAAALDYESFGEFASGWSSYAGSEFTFDYTTLRSLVRAPNSFSDGRANTVSINDLCYFLRPFTIIRFLARNSGDLSGFSVNGVETDLTQIDNTYAPYEPSAVMDAVRVNNVCTYNGETVAEYVVSTGITNYLPAIEQLETIAESGGSPLVAGRTYWSSTVDTDGEPVALQINSDGTHTRTKPGAGTSAYVHPVRDQGQ